MNISAPFIRRPVTTILVMVVIVVFGIQGYRHLPVNDLPTVDFPTIVVSASLPGASPETMAAAVATPLEKQFSTIAGIDNMTSSSRLGSTQITIQFTLERNIDAAAQDVQAMIATALPDLPAGILPPSYRKSNPTDRPILLYVLTSPLLKLSDVDEYAETVLAQRISMVPGVAEVAVNGQKKYAVRVQLDPTKLAYQKIEIDEVADAIARQNINLPTGVLWGPTKAYTLEVDGQLTNAAGFQQIIVAYRNGVPVYLADVGHVFDDVQNNKLAGWSNGTRSIILAVQRQPGTNTLEVATAVKKLVAQLRRQIPPSVQIRLFMDRTQSITESVSDVKFTLVLTLVLVIGVIFLFLRNASATAIPSLALPISVVGTFAVMYLLGYTIDNLSLMALTLAIGFVVDDAVVVLENIVRHMEMGKTPMRAAMDGAREVSFTILSMTLSLVAVFIPVLFLGGIVGRLFHEFAVVIAVAILVSGFVSLTLTPMLASRFLRPEHEREHGRFYDVTERGWQWALGKYDLSLHWVMRHRVATMGFSLLILAGTILLFVVVPKGFIPSEDTGELYFTTEAAQGISFDDMRVHQQRIDEILQKDPNVQDFTSSIGAGGAGGPTSANNQGRLSISLKPRGQRVSVEEFMQELRPKFARVRGIVVYMQNPPAIQVGGRVSKSLYQFTMQSSDIGTMYPAAQKLVAAVRKSPLVQDVTSDLQLGNPQASIHIDRSRAASLGVDPAEIGRAHV